MRHEGQHLRKTQGAGLVGVGASAAPSGNQHVDEALQPAQRALERDEGDRAGTRGDKLDAGAEHLPNERFDNP